LFVQTDDISQPVNIVFKRRDTFFAARLDQSEVMVKSSIKLDATTLADMSGPTHLITLKQPSPMFHKKKYQLDGFPVPFSAFGRPGKDSKVDDFTSDSEPWKMRVVTNDGFVTVIILMLDGRFKHCQLQQRS